MIRLFHLSPFWCFCSRMLSENVLANPPADGELRGDWKMWYWILYLVLALWVVYDANRRKNNFILWGIAVLIVGPIAMPIYFAKRNLKSGETREGGTGWNVLKNFALLWTLTMFIAGIVGMVGAGEVVNNAQNGAEQAGAVIGAGLGLTMILMLWFFPMVFALVLGFFLKKSSIVEKGPTGRLASVLHFTPFCPLFYPTLCYNLNMGKLIGELPAYPDKSDTGRMRANVIALFAYSKVP